jgi:hypothetical protein
LHEGPVKCQIAINQRSDVLFFEILVKEQGPDIFGQNIGPAKTGQSTTALHINMTLLKFYLG